MDLSRLAASHGEAFFVHGLTSTEFGRIIDEASDAPKALYWSLFLQGLIAESLHDEDGPVFSSREQVGVLDDVEVNTLAGIVSPALDIVSPTFAYSDANMWLTKLQRGAAHISNIYTASVMANCVDGPKLLVQRPDWFFGLPLIQMTDGHHMAFRAARRAMKANSGS